MSGTGNGVRVVVFGGTGRTGRLIVEQALLDGHRVTVAARHPEGAGLPPAVRVVRADVQDPASVAAAVRDQDALVLAISSPARTPGTLYSDAARNVVAAAEVAGVTRAVVISSGGVDRDDPGLPFWYRRILIPMVMSSLYAEMGEMEKVITRSTLDWTIVRASYLQDRTATARYRVEEGRTPRRGWKLSRADLARFVVDQLDSDRWLRAIPTLAD